MLNLTPKQNAYLILHFCVMIWGFTAVLGGLISLQALPLVWWRVTICCLILPFFAPLSQLRTMDRRQLARFFGIGMLVGIHWVCFYGAIKWSNASVAVISMAATSLFASFLEPAILKTKFVWQEALVGLLILPGMFLIVENIDWQMREGFFLGILGAFLAALFSVLNKREIERPPAPPLLVSFIELGAIVVMLSCFMPFLTKAEIMPTAADWLWLGILSVICTLLPYYLTLIAMRHLSAFTTNLTIVLEPVYGVFLAALILHEHKTLPTGFYWGALLIGVMVFGHPLLRKFWEKEVA